MKLEHPFARNITRCSWNEPRVWHRILIQALCILALAAATGGPVAVHPAERSVELTRQIGSGKWFSDHLRVSHQPTPAENQALLEALLRLNARTNRDDVSSVTEFLKRFPASAWAVSLKTELGCEYYRTGWYTKALDAWEEVWRDRTNVGPSEAQISIGRAGSHLAGLYARLGRMEQLHQLLPQLDAAKLTGPDAERVRGAKDGLWSMENTPEIAFRCGPLALDRIRSYRNPTNAMHPVIWNSKSTTNGVSLSELAKLSADLGMNYQIAFRTAGSKLITPAVVHWKAGHYAGLVKERNGLYFAQDPTFGNDAWISAAALDHEASGYFLIPSGPLPAGWRTVAAAEAGRVFGKGATDKSNPDDTTPYDQTLNDNDDRSAWDEPDSCGMARWDTHLLLVSQEIIDTPVGYRPPFGPPVFTTVRFVQRMNERYGYHYSWTHNWQGFLLDDALNQFDSVWVWVHGWLTFNQDDVNTNLFRCQQRSPGVLRRTSPTNYVWEFPDGTRRIYSTDALTNNGTLRYVAMTGIEDAAGNRVSIGVNTNGTVGSITDAIGQTTRFYYELPDPGEPSPLFPGDPVTFNYEYPSQPTRIVDPFGRTAQFQYAKVIRTVTGYCGDYLCQFRYYGYDLTNIIDVAGLSSQLSYTNTAGSDYVRALTTPYGMTSFQWSAPGGRNTVLEITDPNGDKERIEYAENPNVNIPFAEVFATVPQNMATWNRYLYYRNTYYWDKKAYAEGFATNDYSKARIYHFAHEYVVNAASGILESFKQPLENRVWFNYPNQALATVPGTGDLPVKIGRVLDDGTTQLQQFERNSLGNITKSIDPIGRTLTFVYATNDIDLVEVRQTRDGDNELLMQVSYDDRHLPLTVRDAAGQLTRLEYNLRGQLLSVTNARNETVGLVYDTNGYLVAIDGPLPGAQDRDVLTYDSAGRVRTVTDPAGYTVTVDYDSLDRLTRITFPDGTWEQITYDRLKPGVLRDRLGRQTFYTYDSLQQIQSVQDPLGRVTRFDWCKCGDITGLIDPMGRLTTWRRDIQGRVIAKEYTDGSKVSYDYERTTSRLRQIRDEQNQLTQFSYYADDSLKEKRYVNAITATPPVRFTYDQHYWRVSTMEDGNGTTSFSYLPITGSNLGAGGLAAIDGPWASDTISFSYDELGRPVSRAINGTAVRHYYDAADRLTQMTNILGAFTYTWEAGSQRISSAQYPNGQRTEYGFYGNLQDQMLQRITHRLPNNAILSEFTQAFNSAPQITNLTQTQSGTVRTWASSYDAADRLLGVSESSSTGSSRAFSYDYDAADNRTVDQMDATRREFFFNPLNELIAMSNSPMAGVSYSWDAENRLVAISNGTHRTEFSYDGLDRRTRIVEKENNVVVSDRRYLWCAAQICEERDSTGGTVLKRFFTHGVRAESGSDLPTGNYFFTRDYLGSVREMVDASGLLQAQYDYSPYGVRQRTGGSLDADFGFTGHVQPASSGLVLAPFRTYDPGLGRWLSRDPIGEVAGANLYSYVGGNPLNLYDPLGLEADVVFGGLDKNLSSVAKYLPSTEGEISVVIHGNKKGSFEKTSKGTRAVSVQEIAQKIRSISSFRQGRTVVRLISCNTGLGNFPQELANELHTDVLAPLTRVRASTDGTLTVPETGKSVPFKPFSHDINLGPKAEVKIGFDN